MFPGTSPVASPLLEVHNHSTDSIDLEKKKREEIIIAKVSARLTFDRTYHAILHYYLLKPFIIIYDYN